MNPNDSSSRDDRRRPLSTATSTTTSHSSRALEIERRLHEILGLAPRDKTVDNCILLGVNALDAQFSVELTKVHLALDGAALSFDHIIRAMDEAKAKVVSHLKG